VTRLDVATPGLLLDTHVLLWLASAPERCGDAIEVLNDPGVDLWISSASTWELAIKSSLGRLELPSPPADYVEERRERLGALLVSIDHRHAGAVASLPWHHRDPFDRILLAQASEMGLTLATADRRLAAYDVPILAVG
jgi:PIN domain nuclease of toxin-antitoxin system